MEKWTHKWRNKTTWECQSEVSARRNPFSDWFYVSCFTSPIICYVYISYLWQKVKVTQNFPNVGVRCAPRRAITGKKSPWLMIINKWKTFFTYYNGAFLCEYIIYTSIITSGTRLLIVNSKVTNLWLRMHEYWDTSGRSDVQQTPFAFIYTESVTWLLTFHLALSCHFFGFANFSFSLDLSTVTFHLTCDLINSEISYM